MAFPTLHHLCVSLGLYLIIQGVFVLQPTRTPEEKERGLLWHEIFTLGLGLPLMTYGVWVMWEMHDRPGSQHFVSWHGTLGIFIILALWLQSIFGIIMLWAYKPFFGTKARAQAMWKYHRYVQSKVTHTQYERLYIYCSHHYGASSCFLGSKMDLARGYCASDAVCNYPNRSHGLRHDHAYSSIKDGILMSHYSIDMCIFGYDDIDYTLSLVQACAAVPSKAAVF